MPLDGLSLNVLIKELESKLKNGRTMKIYQPGETTITLQLRLPGKTETLLISADANNPRLYTLEEQPQNPLNPPAFCMLLRKYLEPSRLIKIKQQGFDRICHLHFEALDEVGQSTELVLILEIMGRQSNLYLVNQDWIILDALRRFSARDILPGKTYIPPSDQGKIEPGSLTNEEFIDELRLLPAPTMIWRWLADTFQGFSKLAAHEVCHRAGFASQVRRSDLAQENLIQLKTAFDHLLLELNDGGYPAFYPNESGDFAAYKLTNYHGQKYTSTNSLIRTILGDRKEQSELESSKATLRRQLATHHKRLLKKKALQEQALQEAENAEHFRHQGELLTASFHLIPTGKSSVLVPDYTTENLSQVKIDIDPRLSPSGNVQRIFKLYNKLKASQKYTTLQLNKTEIELEYLEGLLLQIELADDKSILEEIKLELITANYLKQRSKVRSRKVDTQAMPDHYLSSDGLSILVGRNNRQNDQLTFRLSDPNHLWLHAKNIPGSHVIISATGEIPSSTLLEAASLAAYYSQSRDSSNVPVDYTLKKHVRKPKGARPGFVHYKEAKTIFVNPLDLPSPKKE